MYPLLLFIASMPDQTPDVAHMMSQDCAHRLVQSGPYRLIRHPGESAGLAKYCS